MMNDIGEKKQIFHCSKSRNDGVVSPAFCVEMLLFMWFGAFALLSVNENPDPSMRFILPTNITLMFSILFLYLFQSYKLSITTDYVTWETCIIPSIWTESWEEPIANYCEIKIIKTKPESIFRLKYNPARIAYPKKKGGKNPSESAKAFNKKPHAVIILGHCSNRKKNVSLKCFAWKQTDMWNKAANQIGKDLGLPISDSNS